MRDWAWEMDILIFISKCKDKSVNTDTKYITSVSAENLFSKCHLPSEVSNYHSNLNLWNWLGRVRLMSLAENVVHSKYNLVNYCFTFYLGMQNLLLKKFNDSCRMGFNCGCALPNMVEKISFSDWCLLFRKHVLLITSITK